MLPDQKPFKKDILEENERIEEDHNSMEIEDCDSEFDFIVSEDGLKASLLVKAEEPDKITVDNIKSLLETKGIRYGIVNDTIINEYLMDLNNSKKMLEIAEGRPPKPGKDAEIKYYFDTDPLKIGTVKEGDRIDFKDRGEIPQVKKGDIIAEKIPLIKEEQGIDVYGNPITTQAAKDVDIRCGSGAKLSEDGLKVLAEIDGKPEISAGGRLNVVSELRIDGDVDLSTGHIDFDGGINVRGTIQEGFYVKASSVSANEIYKAEIEVTGDIVVIGGVIGARVKSQGNIRARYIHQSEIEAFGDVVVEKGVTNSILKTRGSCLIQRGKILSSKITAYKAIEADQIGSESSKPCTLVVGVDANVEKEIRGMRDTISLKEDEQGKLKSLFEEFGQELLKIEKEMDELMQMQRHTIMAQRTSNENMNRSNELNDKEKISQTENDLRILDIKRKALDESLKELSNKQSQIKKEISDIRNKIKCSEKDIEDLHNQISAIDGCSKSEQKIPAVVAHDMIFEKTTINGLHSSLVLEENIKNTQITEVFANRNSNDSKCEWYMNIA